MLPIQQKIYGPHFPCKIEIWISYAFDVKKSFEWWGSITSKAETKNIQQLWKEMTLHIIACTDKGHELLVNCYTICTNIWTCQIKYYDLITQAHFPTYFKETKEEIWIEYFENHENVCIFPFEITKERSFKKR